MQLQYKYWAKNLSMALACFTLWGCAAAVTEPSSSKNSSIQSINPYLAKGRKIDPRLLLPLTTENTPQTSIAFKEDASNWEEFVQFLLVEAKRQGFEEGVLEQIKTLTYDPRVVRSDQRQYERILANRRKAAEGTSVLTTPVKPVEASLMQKYLNMHISQAKIERAASLLQNYDKVLTKIAAKYKVPKEVIVGLWGMESNFGKTQGSYNLLDALASLAYEGRRRVFFTREFFNALRLMEINGFSKQEMNSSWAGAVGQTQFMPTSYLVYGADGNDDGVINIWLSVTDSFASIANYLHKEGWDASLPWGYKVTVSFQDYLDKYKELAGSTKTPHTLKEWKDLGIVPNEQQSYMLNAKGVKADTPLWLIIPANEPKQAYLVTNNFRVYMHWNRSEYFAYANGMFANDIAYELQKREGKN